MRKTKPPSDLYVETLSENENELKLKARVNSEKLGLGAISLSKSEGQILGFCLAGIRPRKVVEVGTLTGLSALYILESMDKDGYLWTLEKSEEHAALAAEVLADPIKNGRCEILVGDARQTLKDLSVKGPFDAVFIDGNKAAYEEYFSWAVANIRVGGLVVADNVFLSGAVWGGETPQNFNEKQIASVDRMNRRAFADASLQSAILPTQEGLLVCRKIS